MERIRKGPSILAAQERERTGAGQPLVQRRLRNGKWSVPRPARTYGKETPEQVVERLTRNNPGTQYRLAQED